MPVDSTTFRSVMGRFATGVVLVTMQNDGELHGMTANAFSSVSLDPPLILVCVDKENRTHDKIEASGKFAINVLSENQERIAARFASPSRRLDTAFDGLDVSLSDLGNPLLSGAVAWLDCTMYAAHPAGDHTIFVGHVERAGSAASAEQERPLLFYGGAYNRLRV